MPEFEMPLDQLRSYQGRNPRPADFDAYWDRALSDLDATPPALELAPHPNPARFAECFDLWFTGVGGARVHAQYLRPRSEGPHPAILRFHGYGDLARDAYEEVTYYFTRFDPTHEHEDEVFTKLGYIDVQHLADRIAARVQMTTGLMDMICPPSTQFAAYNKIRSEKEMILYPDFGHDDLPGHHDRLFEFLSAGI